MSLHCFEESTGNMMNIATAVSRSLEDADIGSHPACVTDNAAVSRSLEDVTTQTLADPEGAP
eukprot:3849505-Heterocapsa_arctica.AAC.1